MSTYVIGDVQGCFAELQQLLAALRFEPATDELWFVGDLVNRGPDNLGCVNFIRSLPRCRVVLGNHDLHFLAVAAGAQPQHKSDTLDDLLQAPERDEIVHWFRQQPLMHVDEHRHCAMVHAGLPPIWRIADGLARAAEVEAMLKSPACDDFLLQMYGNQPATWSDALTGPDRLRIITNYFTRLRYCKSDGTLELTHKEDIQPEGFGPWFRFPREDTDMRILFGHWAALNGITEVHNMIALDTGCVWGRRLTAYNLENGQRTSVPAIKLRS